MIEANMPLNLADELPAVVHEYRDADALFSVYEQLHRSGMKPTCIIHDGTRLSVQYREPDGTTVELRCDNPMVVPFAA
jgi:hypothetical protein